jgi:hypothetical protein
VRTADIKYHLVLGRAAKRDLRADNSRNDNSRNDEANDFHLKTTAACCHTTACPAAEARYRLPGGGMTGQYEAAASAKADRI